ncbi:hypothetical protein [Winogradskyella flava]|uniref:hypothetical protein n=1 Tax=Winogradskyella flava TaxID=1884876 RepID=UPI0024901125|nr:hypothetical protein [Winogradskyella flava]
MISETNENKLFKLHQHFDVILEDGLEIIKKKHDSFNVYENLFNRFISCFDSIQKLISGLDDKNLHRAYPIAIILRASLLDYLTILYLRTYFLEAQAGIKGAKTSYKIEYDKLLSEQLRRLIMSYGKEKNHPAFEIKKYQKFIDTIYEHYTEFFNPDIPIDYSNPVKSMKYGRKDEITTTVIRKRLDHFAPNMTRIDYLTVFTLYDIYSKHDHFGMASILFSKSNINDVLDYIFRSIFNISDGLGVCIDFLNEELESKEDFSKIDNEIPYLRGTLHTKKLYLSDEYKQRKK